MRKITPAVSKPRINTYTKLEAYVRQLRQDQKDRLLGQVVYDGEYATRVSPGLYYIHDGRLVRKPKGMHVGIDRSPVTGAALRELTKGLMLSDPSLILRPVEATLLEQSYQLASKADAGWMRKNVGPIVRLFSNPFGAMMGAVSTLKNHDGDIEAKYPKIWKAWQDRLTCQGPTPTQTAAAVAGRLRDRWVRFADTAMRNTNVANTIKRDPQAHLADAPRLSLIKKPCGRRLLAKDLSAVKNRP